MQNRGQTLKSHLHVTTFMDGFDLRNHHFMYVHNGPTRVPHLGFSINCADRRTVPMSAGYAFCAKLNGMRIFLVGHEQEGFADSGLAPVSPK